MSLRGKKILFALAVTTGLQGPAQAENWFVSCFQGMWDAIKTPFTGTVPTPQMTYVVNPPQVEMHHVQNHYRGQEGQVEIWDATGQGGPTRVEPGPSYAIIHPDQGVRHIYEVQNAGPNGLTYHPEDLEINNAQDRFAQEIGAPRRTGIGSSSSRHGEF